MAKEISSKDFETAFKYNIKDIPLTASDVIYNQIQKEIIGDSKLGITYCKYNGDIIYTITLDNYLSYINIYDLSLLLKEGVLLKNNTTNEFVGSKCLLNSIEGGKVSSTSGGFTEQNLYLYTNNTRYNGYVPDDNMYGMKYGYFLGEVHNERGLHSLTLAFRVTPITKVVKKPVVKITTPKGVYVDSEQYKVVEACYKLKKPCLFMGPTGSGKTTIVRELAKQNKHTLVRINLNGEITKEDLVGTKTLDNGTVKWVDGPLTTALRKGYIILFDEINAALPEVLMLLQALTETHDGKLGDLMLNENNGELVHTHENCRIFGTGNPSDEYIGTKDFNPATLSRWIVLYIDYLKQADEVALLTGKYSKILGTEIGKIKELVKFANVLRKEKLNDNIVYMCSTRDIEQALDLYTVGIRFNVCLDTAILNKAQNSDDKKVIAQKISAISNDVISSVM